MRTEQKLYSWKGFEKFHQNVITFTYLTSVNYPHTLPMESSKSGPAIWTLLFSTDMRNIFLVSFIPKLPTSKFKVKIDVCEKQHLLNYALQPTLALRTLR